MFGIDVCQVIRSISKHEVPVYSWQSGGSTPIYWFTAPENRGGIGDVSAKSQEIAKTSGKTPREVEFEVCRPLIWSISYLCLTPFFIQLWHPTTGKVVELPGIGKIYNYECSLQLGAEDVCVAHLPFSSFPPSYLHPFFLDGCNCSDGWLPH